MSFILDALKKIERQKQEEERSTADEQPVLEGGRRWGETRSHISVTMGGVVAIALAALVLAGLALMRAYRDDRTSSAVARPPATDDSVNPKVDRDGEGLVSSELSPSPSPPPASDEVVEAKPDAVVNRVEPEESESSPAEEIETAHPVRLTGQGDSKSAVPEGAVVNETALAKPPAGVPELALQGTSIVDGRPVAVVNFQRLFEGDTIDGAKVIRILDRVVELEFEGTRFVIEF